MKSAYSEKVPAKRVPMVFWYVLVDFSRDAWLYAFELCPWGCLTLDGHAWLKTLTLYKGIAIVDLKDVAGGFSSK